jgi:hypothetical protein
MKNHIATTLKQFLNENVNSNIIKVNNANNIIDYWERNEEDSDIYLQFIDFDKIEVSIGEEYDGSIEDAIERVENVIYSAKL